MYDQRQSELSEATACALTTHSHYSDVSASRRAVQYSDYHLPHDRSQTTRANRLKLFLNDQSGLGDNSKERNLLFRLQIEQILDQLKSQAQSFKLDESSIVKNHSIIRKNSFKLLNF